MTAIPARPAAPRRRGVPRRTVIEVAALAGTLGGSMLALAAGSLVVHVVLGLAFAWLAAVHVARRARTVRNIARKGWARMQTRTRRRMTINAVSTVAAVLLVPTGLVSWVGLGGGGLHGLAGIVLLGVVGAHLAAHRTWLRALAAQLSRRPALAAG